MRRLSVALLTGTSLLFLAAPRSSAAEVNWVEDFIYHGHGSYSVVAREAPVIPAIDPLESPRDVATGGTVTVTGHDLDILSGVLPSWELKAKSQGPSQQVTTVTVQSSTKTELTFVVDDTGFPDRPQTYWLYAEQKTTGIESNRIRFGRVATLDDPIILESDPVSAGWIRNKQPIKLIGQRFGSNGVLLVTINGNTTELPANSWTPTTVTVTQPDAWSGLVDLQVKRADGKISNKRRINFRAHGAHVTVAPGAGFAGETEVHEGAETIGLTNPSFTPGPGGALYYRQGALPANGLCQGTAGGDTLLATTAYDYDAFAFEVPGSWDPGLYYICALREDSEASGYVRFEVVAAGDPLIASVHPPAVVYNRPTALTIMGANFVPDQTAFAFVMSNGDTYRKEVGEVAIQGNNDVATLTTPDVTATGPGPADLRVEVAGRAPFTLSNALTFIDQPFPVLTGIQPRYVSTGPPSSLVTLTGAHFLEGDNVLVGTVVQTPYSFTPTEIVFLAPYLDAGEVPVVVVRDYGTFHEVRSNALMLTYVEPAIVTDAGYWRAGEPMTSATWANFWDDPDGQADVLLTHGGGVAWNPTAKLATDPAHSPRQEDTTDVTRIGLPGNTAAYRNAAWGDINNDGTLDVIVVRDNPPGEHLPLLLFTDAPGDAEPRFTDVTSQWRLTGPFDLFDSRMTDAAFVDYNRDGWLDLYVTVAVDGARNARNVLFRNTGQGTFEGRGIVASDNGDSVAVVVGDINNDQWPDLFVVNRNGRNTLYLNHLSNGPEPANGVDVFQDITAGSPELASSTAAHSSAAFGDYDGDGYADLIVTARDGQHALYHNAGNRTFTKPAQQPQEPWVDAPESVDAAWADMNGDGALELILAYHNANSRVCYRQPNGDWAVLSLWKPGPTGPASSIAIADRYLHAPGHTSLGTPDLLVSQDGTDPAQLSTLLVNLAESTEYMRVLLQGAMSNRAAVGAHIALEANGQIHRRELESATGDELGYSVWFKDAPSSLDRLTVRWPSGLEQVWLEAALDPMWRQITRVVEPDQRLFVTERTTGQLKKLHPITQALVWQTAVGTEPTQLAVKATGETAYVATKVPGNPAAYQVVGVAVPTEAGGGATGTVTTIPLGEESPVDVAIVPSADGQVKQLLVLTRSGGATDQLHIFELAPQQPPCLPSGLCPETYAETAVIDVSGQSKQLLVGASGAYAYVVSPFDIAYINLATRAVEGTLPIPVFSETSHAFEQAAFNIAGDRLYASQLVEQPAKVFTPHLLEYELPKGDPNQARILQTIELAGSGPRITMPWLVFDTVRHEVYTVFSTDTNAVRRVHLETQAVTTLAGPVGHTGAVSAAGHRLWMIDQSSGRGNVGAYSFNLMTLEPVDTSSMALSDPADVAVGVAH